jgi:hypothetical protein
VFVDVVVSGWVQELMMSSCGHKLLYLAKNRNCCVLFWALVIVAHFAVIPYFPKVAQNISINDLNIFSFDFVPFCCSVFSLCYFFTAVPSITWRGSTVPSSHNECSAGNWLTRNNFCTVLYRSECIYILQINFIKKKKGGSKKQWKSPVSQSLNWVLTSEYETRVFIIAYGLKSFEMALWPHV